MAFVLLRRSRSPESGGQYHLEERGERYQSMYSSKQNGENMASPHYEQLKLNDRTNGVYQSIDDSKSGEKQNNSKANTPPGTEKGQKDTKETEKETKTLSSFQNPAYQTSMGSGMDVEYDVIPAAQARDGDMAL
ncbi:hypothetical protein OS493_022428 [Desmophyllum pertusum]|uniref:Uncharacterized protein n=1 Tax=Desmophyllum pertusum TaxID=174260 RepID=A0A9W9ZMM9_9CNID|nr:hypothetical protein OS493_022428 [Desmophyllum pertusum]